MALYRITFSGLLFGVTWNNVLHFQTGVPAPTPAEAADIVDTHWVDNFRTWQHTSLQWLDIAVQDVATSPLPATFHKTIFKTGNAGSAGNTDQVVLAIVVKKLTAVGGPSGRGRIFIPGFLVNASTNIGQLRPETVTAFTPTLNTIMARFGPAGDQNLELVICNRSNPAASTKSVTGLALRVILGTMRSRNYGVGA